MQRFLGHITVFGLLLAVNSAFAAPDKPSKQELETPIPMSATQTLDISEQMYVGETFKIDVELQHPSKYDISAERVSRKHTVELQRVDRESSSLTENKQRTSLTFVYQVFTPGRFELPAIDIQLNDGETTKTLKTEPVSVSVESTLEKPSDQLEFKNHTEPLNVTRFSYRRLWFSVGTASLLALALFVLWRRRRIQSDWETTQVDPYRRATERLETLEKSRYIEQEEFEIFFMKLSHIVREFLENYYDFPACEQTTGEIREQLKRVQLPEELSQRTVYNWLIESDYYKFSGSRPDKQTAQTHLKDAVDIIDYFEPSPDAPEESTSDTEGAQ